MLTIGDDLVMMAMIGDGDHKNDDDDDNDDVRNLLFALWNSSRQKGPLLFSQHHLFWRQECLAAVIVWGDELAVPLVPLPLPDRGELGEWMDSGPRCQDRNLINGCEWLITGLQWKCSWFICHLPNMCLEVWESGGFKTNFWLEASILRPGGRKSYCKWLTQILPQANAYMQGMHLRFVFQGSLRSWSPPCNWRQAGTDRSRIRMGGTCKL